MTARTRNASRRVRVAKLASGATIGLAGVALVIGSIPSAFAVQVDGNTPLDPCLGTQCPPAWSEPNNGGVVGFDDGVNVFVGGDFSAEPSAAETEGNLVVLGDATFDSPGSYNLGVAGVGSRVPPPSGSTMLTVGGDLDIAAGTNLIVGGDTGFPDFTPIVGNVEYGGTLTGTPSVLAGATVEQGDGAAAFADRVANITALSQCLAQKPATGTVIVADGTATFTGDGTSDPQVFYVDGSLTTGQIAVASSGIPAGATMIINVTSTNPVIQVNSWFNNGSNAFDPLATQYILTNIPNATTATISGGAQYPGSILVGNPASVTTISIAGTNGRIEVAGDLIHQSPPSSSTGVELHAYPFSGTATCDTPTTPPTTTTAPPTTTTPTTPPPTTPTPTTEPPTTPPATPTVTPTPTSSSTPTPTPAPADLAETGSPAGAMMAVGAALIGVGAVTAFTARRRRA
ncbi:choice-of-anchor A domain-containing protein [Agromyces terreus]|uniref:Choice-of-anchor A domain-containing protein n=1 Tax=Agromyces terreus TaxID=424795 RepID=A0A9X2H021_9MICO|nr:choice-of-anchor A family protein [Agromyces terreus]MCP2370280.1 choice-of-anchor A domain-containing protein [Agromyces terreus]